MSDLRTDVTLDARIKTLESEIVADAERARIKDEEATAAMNERAALWDGIAKKKAALEELRAAWAARALPVRETR